ncbi:MAG: transaldolase [Calditrichia bacterium]|nr:transaldolase [Calditrichota bacterium]MCB0270694.1 transaldolase [Calditrichota bacterium]MCB0287654.1 transaldolase [Calditrichota bacterium]MCB9069780.1 transaldolase [Calditrichia bacterium]
MEKIKKLIDYGQSYWLDNLSREMIRNGELRRRVEKEGLRGITSNPAIFNNAISNSNAYDEQIHELFAAGKSVEEIYEVLAVQDVQDACDLMRPVFDESDGLDGFVSLEVSPHLANDTEGTIAEGHRLYQAVNRPNLMIKVPGTEAGVPAIEQLLFDGVNVNVTLLFAIDSYNAVAKAYLRALKRRFDAGKPVNKIRSVASFFLSRIDVLVDKQLETIVNSAENAKKSHKAQQLMGKVAIASAKLAYQDFKKIFSGSDWLELVEKGAAVQRPLWASTSTKNPEYRDVMYVEPLIGPDTVNTLPEQTIEAFADHGELVANTIEDGITEARQALEDLAEVGIDLEKVTDQLVEEGIQKFVDPFVTLLNSIREETAKVQMQ